MCLFMFPSYSESLNIAWDISGSEERLTCTQLPANQPDIYDSSHGLLRGVMEGIDR